MNLYQIHFMGKPCEYIAAETMREASYKALYYLGQNPTEGMKNHAMLVPLVFAKFVTVKKIEESI